MGGVLNALYVRGDDVAKVRAHYAGHVDEGLADLETRVGAAFVAVDVSSSSDFAADPDLSSDSLAFGEAILLQLTAFGDDVLRYDHWRDGRLARRLQYSPGAWTVVEGAPEPWEERAFLEPPKARRAATISSEGVLAALIKHVGLPPLWPR